MKPQKIICFIPNAKKPLNFLAISCMLASLRALFNESLQLFDKHLTKFEENLRVCDDFVGASYF